ncbi:hypothetical protein QO000_002985 [Alkalihalobacillus hemicentroti]|uniref:Uncharacterized protein n=1 Tax=Guptibacillus hwajinpoensis TaxID=208199 RepID=A0ABU0K685_9BACL|nr:hypothetical protein [Alkalihalobacillus hemicentroti]
MTDYFTLIVLRLVLPLLNGRKSLPNGNDTNIIRKNWLEILA